VSEPSFDIARADLEGLVTRQSEQHHCSIAWGVVHRGELVLTGAVAAEPDPKPTEQTVFRIASMTKSFTAAAVMILRDSGALRLDDVVADIAPEFEAVQGPTADSPPITIRHLLSMSAGMATDDAWADRHLDLTDDELDDLVRHGATFAWPPHSHGEYSNLGFAMLGRVIMRVSGMRAQDFITTNLLQPLGMDRTTWTQPEHDDWALPYEVVDHQRVGDIDPLGDGAIAPMGGLWSCVADLARWVSWFAGAFPARDDPDAGPLRRASRREMQQVHRAWPTVRTAATGDGHDAVPERIDGGGYGFGLFVMHDDRFGHFVAHSGGLPGYGSNMRWLPGRSIGIVALGNVTYAPMSMMTRRMLEILDDHGLAGVHVHSPSPALIDAAHRLAQLLSDWNDADAHALFADNVALDEALPRRASRAGERVAAHGALTVVDVTATTPTRGRAAMRHDDGTAVMVDVELSPLIPPRIQFYEVAADAAG
jgi:CubicO group peptidase (beta-lactamase class C family)